MRPSFKLLACALFLPFLASGQSKLLSIAGRISDLAGNPIEGATVKILALEGEPIWRGVTDSTGEFGANNLRQGTHVVEVAARGFHNERRIVILKADDASRLDIGLIAGELTYTPPIAVSGVVRDSSGMLLSRATLTVRAVFNSRLTTRAKTDGRGHYSLPVSNPGRYEIVVLANDGRSITVLASLGQPWANQTLDISLR